MLSRNKNIRRHPCALVIGDNVRVKCTYYSGFCLFMSFENENAAFSTVTAAWCLNDRGRSRCEQGPETGTAGFETHIPFQGTMNCGYSPCFSFRRTRLESRSGSVIPRNVVVPPYSSNENNTFEEITLPPVPSHSPFTIVIKCLRMFSVSSAWQKNARSIGCCLFNPLQATGK